jgi:hypothetical protein
MTRCAVSAHLCAFDGKLYSVATQSYSEAFWSALMFPQWGYTIPVSVFMLGACSVYDSSLLTTSPIVPGGAGGAAGADVAGAAGVSGVGAGVSGGGGREPESEAGASGSANELGGGAGSGAVSGNAQGGAGASAGGSGGTAGTATGGNAGMGGGGAAGAPVVLALETIDTMEDHDGAIDNTGSRNGDWYAGHDATATGMQTPGSTFTMSALPTSDSRYNASTDKWAAMTKGMGFNDWGEDMGFNMMLVPVGEMYHPPYDATPYCGVHFFARVGVGASSTVIFRVPDKNSLPDGGICGVGGMPCYAYFQKVYSFNTTWTEYNVLFSDLRSTGWPTALAQNAIFSVEFGLASKSVFELWIDDVSFLKKPAGGACPTVYP